MVVAGAVQQPVPASAGAGDARSVTVRFSLDHLYGRASTLLRPLSREPALARVPSRLRIAGPDGAAIAAGRLSAAVRVRLRVRLVSPRSWEVGAEGTALPTFRVLRIQVVRLRGGDAGSCADATCTTADGTSNDGMTTEEPPPDGQAPAPEDDSPPQVQSRFIGEVCGVDAGTGTVTLHVVAVEGLPDDQTEDDFDGDMVTFAFAADAGYQVSPDRDGDGTSGLADVAVYDLARIDVYTTGPLPVGQTLQAAGLQSRAPRQPGGCDGGS